MANSQTYMVCRSCQDRLRVRGLHNAAWSFARVDDVSEWLHRHRGCSGEKAPGKRSFDFVDELAERTLPGRGSREHAASPGFVDDLAVLIDAAISLTQRELQVSGRFEPFAIALYGDFRMVVLADNLEGEESSPGEAASCLTQYLRARAADGLLAAGALCEHRLSPDGARLPECIRVHAEHRGGGALVVEIPVLQSPSSQLVFGNRISRPSEPVIRWLPG